MGKRLFARFGGGGITQEPTSIYRAKSGINLGIFLGFSGVHTATLMQQKLESGTYCSGVVAYYDN